MWYTHDIYDNLNNSNELLQSWHVSIVVHISFFEGF